MNPEDFCERLRLDDDVVADDEFNGNGFDELVDAWMVVGLNLAVERNGFWTCSRARKPTGRARHQLARR